MPDGLLGVLKLCLLALLYLFVARVVVAVGAELRGPRSPKEPKPEPHSRPSRAERKAARSRPTALVVIAPSKVSRSFSLDGEATIGRAPGCAIVVEDEFASQLHARISASSTKVMVEDLDSTNGTYLNGTKLTSVMPLQPGDRITIGSTVMEAR